MVYPLMSHDLGYEGVDPASNDDDCHSNTEIYICFITIFLSIALHFLVTANSRLKRQVTHYREQNQQSSTDKLRLEQQVEKLKKQILEGEKKFESSQSSVLNLNDEISLLNEQVKAYQDTVSKKLQDLVEANSEVDRLREQIKKHKKTGEHLTKNTSRVKLLQEKIALLESQVVELRSQNAEDTQKISDLERDIECHRKKNDEMIRTVEDIQSSSKITSLEFSRLQEELEVAEDRVASLEAQREKDAESYKGTLVKLALLTREL